MQKVLEAHLLLEVLNEKKMSRAKDKMLKTKRGQMVAIYSGKQTNIVNTA